MKEQPINIVIEGEFMPSDKGVIITRETLDRIDSMSDEQHIVISQTKFIPNKCTNFDIIIEEILKTRKPILIIERETFGGETKVVKVDLTSTDTILESAKPYISTYAYNLFNNRKEFFHREAFVEFLFPTIIKTLNRFIYENNNKRLYDFTTTFIKAIKDKLLIVYYVDSDFDGMSCGGAVHLFHKELIPYDNYVVYPSIRSEGYAITDSSIAKLETILQKHNLTNNSEFLFITADHGSTSGDMFKIMNEKFPNYTPIVTDHHIYRHNEHLPNIHINNQATALNMMPESLSGAGVLVYCLIKADMRVHKTRLKTMTRYGRLLQYVGLTAVSDRRDMLCPINRDIVKYTEMLFPTYAIRPFRSLSNNSYDWGWTLIPIVNSCGRMSKPQLGIDFFSSTEEEYANSYDTIKKLNTVRKKNTNIVRDLVFSDENILLNRKFTHMSFYIIEESDIEALNVPIKDARGVIGIIASSTSNYYYRPSIVFVRDKDGTISGSGRKNVDGNFTFRTTLRTLIKEGLLISGGGHDGAAGGVKVSASKTEEFFLRFDELARELDPDGYSKHSEYDMVIDFKDVTLSLLNEQIKCGPFGTNFTIPNIKFVNIPEYEEVSFGSGNKLVLTESNITVIRWGSMPIDPNNIVGTLTYDNFTKGLLITI